jgi:hypothetical protein
MEARTFSLENLAVRTEARCLEEALRLSRLGVPAPSLSKAASVSSSSITLAIMPSGSEDSESLLSPLFRKGSSCSSSLSSSRSLFWVFEFKASISANRLRTKWFTSLLAFRMNSFLLVSQRTLALSTRVRRCLVSLREKGERSTGAQVRHRRVRGEGEGELTAALSLILVVEAGSFPDEFVADTVAGSGAGDLLSEGGG